MTILEEAAPRLAAARERRTLPESAPRRPERVQLQTRRSRRGTRPPPGWVRRGRGHGRWPRPRASTTRMVPVATPGGGSAAVSQRTSAASASHPPQRRATRRVPRTTDLVSSRSWRKQSGASCAPVARRPITAAGPTPAAAESRHHPFGFLICSPVGRRAAPARTRAHGSTMPDRGLFR